MTRRHLSLVLSVSLLAAGCARPRVEVAARAVASTDAPVAVLAVAPLATPRCDHCTAVPRGNDIMSALELRIADLKARGGSCQAYGELLEGSLARGRIVVRPYMWRVGNSLASAQAKSSGEIDVAREVDPLNVGVRTVDDVVHSIEHEAAHLAFAIPSGQEWNEALVNERVGLCRAALGS